MYAAFALCDDPSAIWSPSKGPSTNLIGFALFSVFMELWPSRIRDIAARWTPASTASKDPFFQPAAVERTRNAVTLSSLGPPPAPCENRR